MRESAYGLDYVESSFYRQKPIGYYIADFYAPAARLIVEVDGSQHADLAQAERDKRRTAYFKEIGLRVLRFNHREVLVEIDSVTEEIFRAVEENPPKRGKSLTRKS